MRHSTCPFSTKGWRRINKHSLGASKMIQTTFYCFSVSAKSPMAVGILNRCLENGWMRANKLKVNLKKILVCQSMEKLLGDYRVSLYWAGCTSLKKQVHSSFIASKCYRILTYNRGWCGLQHILSAMAGSPAMAIPQKKTGSNHSAHALITSKLDAVMWSAWGSLWKWFGNFSRFKMQWVGYYQGWLQGLYYPCTERSVMTEHLFRSTIQSIGCYL